MPSESSATTTVNSPRINFLRLSGLVLALTLAGCATTGTVIQIDKLDSVDESANILVMSPDVKYYLLTASGVPELEPEWTESARVNFSRSLLDFAADNEVDVMTMPEDAQLSDVEISYQKLYSAVGSTVLSHHYGQFKLPTKKGVFDWGLGPGVSEIGDKYGAEYALFTYYREYKASGGRVALSFFAALAGVGLATGGEIGFASLIDLRSGDIVWFNKITTGGELRDMQNARLTVDNLFKNIPLNE